MIKKFVLLILVLVLIPLTYLLYRQIKAMQPTTEMPLVQAVEKELDPQKVMRQWTPPQQSIQGQVVRPGSDAAAPGGGNTVADARQEPQQTDAQPEPGASPDTRDASGQSKEEQAADSGSSDTEFEKWRTAYKQDSTDKGTDGQTARPQFTQKEMLAPQREITELMSAIKARALKNETSNTLSMPGLQQNQQQQTRFPAPQPLPKGVNTLKGLHVVPLNNEVVVQVVCLGAIGSYKSFFVGSPSRLAVDLLGKFNRAAPELHLVDNLFIKDIRTGRHPDKLRVVADLKSSAKLRLSVETPQSNVLLLHLTKQ